MFLLGLGVTLFGLIFFVVVLGGDMYYFMDWLWLLAVLFPLLGVLVATQSFDVFFAGLRAAIFPKTELAEDMRGRAASLFRLLSKVAAISGGIGSLISLISMLMNLDFSYPGAIASIGPRISAALMIPLYGLLLIVVVFEPVVFILKKRYSKRR